MPITTCDSPETLRAEIDIVRKKVALNETEDTWDTITQGILHLTRLCNNGGCEFPSEMIASIRSMSRPLNSALNSERSRLSGAAVEFLTVLAVGLSSSFEPLVSQFVPTLLTLCGRTNKVFTSRARACILAIIQHTRLPSLLPCLAELVNHKSVFPRLTAAEGILACLNCFNPPDLAKETRARIVEDFIKLAARDASADVRKASKEIFKAYKAVLPARVDSFIAPLTPVVRKYLDIQTGPSGTHGTSSQAGQKQTSRPASRANNKVMEVGQRPASSTLSRPPTRPVTDDPAHNARQRPGAHDLLTAVDIRGPRQRTTSQMQRDSQPRGFHINGQSSSAAQRCVVPTSAPTRQAVQQPQPGAAQAPSAPSAPPTGGPQRPLPMQIKFNPAPERLIVTGSGAKRIPLPSLPAKGHTSGQVAVTASSTDRAGTAIDQSRSKLPRQNAEATASGKLAVGRKVPEGTRSVSSSTKPANGSAPVGPAAVKRAHKPSVNGGTSNTRREAPKRRPAGNVQKGTRPLVQAERKETSPTLVPLPPSPSAPPTEIPLPPSPDCTPRPADSNARDEPVVATLSGPNDPVKQLGSTEPRQEQEDVGYPSTPITALLSSIQRGFIFTPSSPLSPPQNYLPAPGNLQEGRQKVMTASDVTAGSLVEAPICISFEDEAARDGLDRHALRDLN